MQTTLVYVLTVAASLFLAGNCQLECFDGSVSECNGGVISGVSTAEDCCLGDGYWFKPDGSEVCKQCIVHGFLRTSIAGGEGTTLYVPASTYLKGEADPRSRKTFGFTITATPETAGREDFRAVRTIATFRDRRRLFGIRIQLNADDIAFEGNETIGLQLTAGNLPANTFLKDRIEVTIIDTTCVYSEWSQWERISQSTISIELSVCDSGMAFRQRRTQTSPMNGCNPIQETRLVCMPDDEDRLISGLGLGSIGFDVGSINTPPSPPPDMEDPTNTTNTATTRRRRQAAFPDLKIPGNRCPGGPDGVGRICTDIDNSEYDCNLPPSPKMKIARAGCDIQTILLILDTSGSIGSSDFERMKRAMSNLIPHFCSKIQVAVITFSHTINLEFCFNCFDNTQDGRTDIQNAILAIPYRVGNTHTGAATRCAIHDIFTSECGLHRGTNCVDVIYITDGRSNGGFNVCNEVRCLHNAPSLSDKINVYAIGIGNANPTEIDCIAGDNDDKIFSQRNFNAFEALIASTTTRLVSNMPKYSCFDTRGKLGDFVVVSED